MKVEDMLGWLNKLPTEFLDYKIVKYSDKKEVVISDITNIETDDNNKEILLSSEEDVECLKMKDLKNYLLKIFPSYEVVNITSGDIPGTDKCYRLDCPIVAIDVSIVNGLVLMIQNE